MSEAKPVTVVIACAIKPGKMEVAKQELESVIAKVLANEPACKGIRVHENPKEPDRLLIFERWDSEEIFNGPHMKTPHQQAFNKKAEDFVDGKPTFSFWYETIVAP